MGPERQIACGHVPMQPTADSGGRESVPALCASRDSQSNSTWQRQRPRINNQMHVSTGVSSASAVVLPAERVLAKGLHKSALSVGFSPTAAPLFQGSWPTFSRGPQFPLSSWGEILHSAFHWFIPYFFYSIQPDTTVHSRCWLALVTCFRARIR